MADIRLIIAENLRIVRSIALMGTKERKDKLLLYEINESSAGLHNQRGFHVDSSKIFEYNDSAMKLPRIIIISGKLVNI